MISGFFFELVLFGGPFALASALFFYLGRFKSGLLLLTLLVILPFALFLTLMNTLPMHGALDVIIPFLVVTLTSIGAVTGGLIGFAIRKHKTNKRQEM